MAKDPIKDDNIIKLIDEAYQMEGNEELRRKLVATAIVEFEKQKSAETKKAIVYGGISYGSLGLAVYFYMNNHQIAGYICTAVPYYTFPKMFIHAIKAEDLGEKLKYLKRKANKAENSINNQITEEAPEI